MTKPDGAARSANIFDVARLAGVSHQTVSRVLNNAPQVRPATRERVELAMKQLRYQPSPAARALVTRRSRTIGVVTAGSVDYGPSSIQMHLNAAASAARYAVLTISAVDTSFGAAQAAIESLLRQNVEAVVLVLPDVSTLENLRVLDLGVPVIAVAAGRSQSPFSVSIDQYGGARTAVRHLLEAGYLEVAHVAGPQGHPDAIERLRGWADELADAGVARGALHQGNWTSSSGYRLGLDLSVTPGRTAVFAGNDQMALGVMSALSQRGIGVPADVGVAGFDDVPEAAFFSPPLTTVRQEFEALGRLALRRVLDSLDQPDLMPPNPPLPTTLVVRSSTFSGSSSAQEIGAIAGARSPELEAKNLQKPMLGS